MDHLFSQVRRSREGAWIEIRAMAAQAYSQCVAPVRERGLNFLSWIISTWTRFVAPVRERGLKLFIALLTLNILQCRSREGAWIEISNI